MRKIKLWAKAHETALTTIGIMLALAALLWVMAGCASPTVANDPVRVIVKNSLWQTVKTITVSDRGSREVVGDDYQAEIEAYNAETLDDFLRAYAEGSVPDIDNAPPVSVFIVNPATYAVNWSAENIPRRSLVDNADAWRADSYGQLLFVDHVPPAPIVIPPPSMYAWYALYLVDGDGQILYEDHCGWTDAEVWDGQWILDGGWRNADHYYETTRRNFWNEVVSHPGWTLVEHRIYTEPAP